MAFWDSIVDWATSGDNADAKKLQESIYGNLRGVVDKGAPAAFGKNLWTGAGGTTLDAWRDAMTAANNPAYMQGVNSSLGFGNNLLSHNGFGGGQGNDVRDVRNVGDAYGNLGDHGGLTDGQSRQQHDLGDVSGDYARLGDHNGLTGGQSHNINTMNGVGNSFAGLGDNNGLTTSQGRNQTNLGGIGQGYAGLSNAYAQDAPGYQHLRDTLKDDTLASVNASFGGSGRLGSGLNISSAARGVGDTLANLDYGNFQNNVNNRYRSLDSQAGIQNNLFANSQAGVGNQFNAYNGQLGAANSAFNAGQQGVNNQFNSLAGRSATDQGIFNNSQTGVNNQFGALAGRLGADGQAFGMDQQGINNQFGAAAALPGMYDNLMRPSQTEGAIGAARDADRAGARAGEFDLYNRKNFNQLDWYNRVAGVGSTAAGGVPTTGNNTPGLLQVAGAAMSAVPWWQKVSTAGAGA